MKSLRLLLSWDECQRERKCLRGTLWFVDEVKCLQRTETSVKWWQVGEYSKAQSKSVVLGKRWERVGKILRGTDAPDKFCCRWQRFTSSLSICWERRYPNNCKNCLLWLFFSYFTHISFLLLSPHPFHPLLFSTSKNQTKKIYNWIFGFTIEV